MIEKISNIVEGFIHIFQLGADHLVGLVAGILPLLLIMLTFFNAIIGLIGEKRVNRFAEKISHYAIFRYTLLPIMAVLLLTSPMCFSLGRFLDEKYKPAFYDAAVSFVHPVLGIFPYANSNEIFVYMGIAAGIEALGFSVAQLAVRYFLVGVIVIFLRGMVTEKFTLFLMKRKKTDLEDHSL